MTASKRIAYISPTTGYTDEALDEWRRQLAGIVPTGFEVHLRSITGGPEYFDEMKHFAQALSAAPAYYGSIDPEEFSVVIAAGAIDPGLESLRAAARVPVVGPGEASLYHASIGRRTMTVVTVDEHAVVKAGLFIEQTAVKPPILGIRSIDFPVRQLMQDPQTADDLLREQCRLAVEEDGAESLYLGCMPFGKLPCARTLADELGVPVYNPWLISIATAVEVARAMPA